MRLLYNLAIYLYQLLINLVACWNPKAKLFCRGRKGIFIKLKDVLSNENSPIIWVHCSSVGEFEQARPIIEWYKSNKEEYKILLTFFSPSGYELRKNYDLADWVFYMPIDTPKNAKRFVEIVNPSKVIFIKYEFWYNHLKELRKRSIDIYIASAIFRPSQSFFKWYGALFRKMLYSFNMLFVQDEASFKLLESIGLAEKASICGDTRFDRVAQITKSSKDFPLIERFCNSKFTLVAGSTWEPDNIHLCNVVKEFPNIKLIIASHEIGKEKINSILALFSEKRVIKFTEFDIYNDQEIEQADVLVIDTIGILSSIYKYGNVAYIGGGFGVGIHNILEAATYSLPIVFGPNYTKFKEARDLISLGGAFSISESEEFINLTRENFLNSKIAAQIGAISGAYVSYNLGATEKIISQIEK